MLPLRNIISFNNLLRPLKAWCPLCYENWHQTEQIVYEPLIWSLDAITICPIHNLPLQVRCHHCYEQPSLGIKYRVGYCTQCQNWLGNASSTELDCNQSLSEDELGQQLCLINYMEDIINNFNVSNVLSREKFQKNLAICIQKLTSGNISAFARLIQEHPRYVNQLIHKKSLLKLNVFFKICSYLQVTPSEFLTKEVNYLNSVHSIRTADKHKPEKKRSHKKVNIEKIQKTLEAALNESPPPSIKDIIIHLDNISRGIIYYHFPDLCFAITSRYNDYQKNKNINELRTAIENILNSNDEPSPSVREVSKILGKPFTALYRDFPELCQSITAKNLSYQKALSLENLEKIRQQVRKAAMEAHNQGMKLHSGSVGKFLAKPGIMKHKVAIAALSEIQHDLGYK